MSTHPRIPSIPFLVLVLLTAILTFLFLNFQLLRSFSGSQKTDESSPHYVRLQDKAESQIERTSIAGVYYTNAANLVVSVENFEFIQPTHNLAVFNYSSQKSRTNDYNLLNRILQTNKTTKTVKP